MSPCEILCSVESFGLGVFALAESMPEVSHLPLSASAEDENDDEEEDYDDCDATYDYQHPHAQPGLDLQRYRSKRQPSAVPPQFTLPLSAVSCTHFRDGEMGGVMVRCQRPQGRLFGWKPFQSQARGQWLAEAARQVELLTRN